MKVANINIRKLNFGSLLASGTATIEDVIEITFTVIKGSKGEFVSLPQKEYLDKQTGMKKYQNQVKFVKEDGLATFSRAVLDLYNGKPSAQSQSGEENQAVDDSFVPF